MFGRHKKDSSEQDLAEATAEADDAAELMQLAAAAVVLARPTGPWDIADAPDDEVNRVDLGGMLIPVLPDTEVRVDVSPEGEVVAATLVRGTSAMQVNAFAAPRTYGIWAEVRGEIGSTLLEGGGRADDVEGPYGTELQAAIPTEIEGQGSVLAPARFIGVDGPRWFLRALVTGPAATDPVVAAEFEAALKQVVVVRGTDPMAVRDPLPMRLPKEVAELDQQGPLDSDQQEDQQDRPAAPSLELPVRGPEITERR